MLEILILFALEHEEILFCKNFSEFLRNRKSFY